MCVCVCGGGGGIVQGGVLVWRRSAGCDAVCACVV